MAGGINFSGISSGIDSASIIDQLIAVERRPEDSMKIDIQRLQQRQASYTGLSAQLIGFQSSAQALNKLRAFDLVSGTSSDTTIATTTVQTGAQVGTHTLDVTKLATSQLVGSTAQASQTAPLNVTGQILINGKAVNVQAADSLQSLASNINAAQAGVTASIISPSVGEYYLTLGSTNTGLQGKISLSDVGDGNLLGSTLGILGSSLSARHVVNASTVGSDLFADSATSVATLAGITTPTVGNVTLALGGVNHTVALDLSKSISALAADINTALGTNVASVTTVKDPITGDSKRQLQLDSTQVTFVQDDKNALSTLGLVQNSYGTGRELRLAQDAEFKIDNLSATRPTNSFSDVVSGVNISLVKAGTTTLSVASDTDTIKGNINAFVKAFNDTVDLVSNQAQYDSSSGKTGPLFGDVTSQTIIDSLTASVSGATYGLPSSFNLLAQAGITLDTGGHLNVDDSILSDKLANNLQGVAKLFRAYGVPTDAQVQFVSSGADTKASPSAGYAINVLSPATQATLTAPVAQTARLLTDETLTFGGPLFGTPIAGSLTGNSVVLHANSTLDDVISTINADSTVGKLLSASKTAGGKLQLTTKDYGTNAHFAVSSTVSALNNTSGLGQTTLDAAGQDVAGTINGEQAAGNGQYLRGTQTTGNVKGSAYDLQVRITATTAGSYGSLVLTKGAADQVNSYVTAQTDTYTGGLSTSINALQDQATDIQSNIDDLEERLKTEQTTLQQQFTNMETSIAKLKASSSGLSSLSTTA